MFDPKKIADKVAVVEEEKKPKPDTIKVKCASCGGIFHETTGRYNRFRYAHGAMFRMLPKYREMGWVSFPEEAHVGGPDLACPDCGAEYCDEDGIVKLLVFPEGKVERGRTSKGQKELQ